MHQILSHIFLSAFSALMMRLSPIRWLTKDMVPAIVRMIEDVTKKRSAHAIILKVNVCGNLL